MESPHLEAEIRTSLTCLALCFQRKADLERSERVLVLTATLGIIACWERKKGGPTNVPHRHVPRGWALGLRRVPRGVKSPPLMHGSQFVQSMDLGLKLKVNRRLRNQCVTKIESMIWQVLT